MFDSNSDQPRTHRVLMNFDSYNDLWWVHFIEADCRTLIGAKTKYYRFATLDGLRSFVVRCNPDDMPEFERSVRAWGRGSNFVNITEEQYAKLKRIPSKLDASVDGSYKLYDRFNSHVND